MTGASVRACRHKKCLRAGWNDGKASTLIVLFMLGLLAVLGFTVWCSLHLLRPAVVASGVDTGPAITSRIRLRALHTRR